jgi:SAM-dependent methyltransferase
MNAPNPAETVLGVATAYWVSRALHEVARLGIADRIGDAPVAAAELAASAGLDASALARTLRALAMAGLFVETSPGVFAHTDASRLLRDDTPGSLRPIARYMGDEAHWRSYAAYGESLRTGRPACDSALGMPIFAWYGTNEEEGEQFNRGMTSFSMTQLAAVERVYDFTRFRRIADIGGGRGHVLAKLLACAPEAEGVLFDLPHAIEHARAACLLPEGRTELITGDFFHAVPDGCDLYVVKHILHDWNDSDSLRILRAIRRAMAPDARLLVLELLRPEGPEPHFAKLLDIEMLVLAGGRERTETEFRDLFAEAGFNLARTIPTELPITVLEGIPA